MLALEITLKDYLKEEIVGNNTKRVDIYMEDYMVVIDGYP